MDSSGYLLQLAGQIRILLLIFKLSGYRAEELLAKQEVAEALRSEVAVSLALDPPIILCLVALFPKLLEEICRLHERLISEGGFQVLGEPSLRLQVFLTVFHHGIII